MSLSPTLFYETPASYSSFPLRGMVYEISLRVRKDSDGIKDLGQAHRLVQSLLQGQLLGFYSLLDFVFWPQGLFVRISLKEFTALSEFLTFLKRQSLYPGHSPEALWDDDLEWIRVISPDKLNESTRRFLEQASHLKSKLEASNGFDPNLFFYYRNAGL